MREKEREREKEGEGERIAALHSSGVIEGR